ncbi:IS256 family transposase [uncultured Methanoregula sp.]|uniref:IS256 family transposase n=1 Tax=uncultured Methanoregula sp. TaxID=1005933 RepID=UPI002AAB8180|nr:IS256 family transposase [uncultured Methanoregula sp.]
MNLRDIVLNYLTDNEKGMQQLITWFLNDVMNEEVAQQAGVPRYARSSTRRAHRNGYRQRSLKTRFGELSLLKPQLREIPFETKVFDRYSRTEKALVNAIIESYLQGVSTRNVETVVSHLGVNQLSASYVSKVSRELDTKVQEFMEKSLDSYYPYLFVDASYFKVRDESRYVNKALLVIVGVRTDGHREVLAARIADAEHELTWEGMFSDLKEQGLTRVDLIISDGHTGIQSAAGRMFPGSSWQMCHVHFIRAVLRKVPRKYHTEIAEVLKECLSDPGKLLDYAVQLDDRGFSRAADTIHRFHLGLFNYRAFPPEFWKKIRTTNLLERVNRELKRRSKKIGAFPCDASLLRLAGSILIDINEEWITGSRYLSAKSEMISLDTEADFTAL